MTEKLNKLKKQIGTKALNALLERKAVLKIWRRTSPYNWYIETKHKCNTLWHSNKELRHLDLNLFEKIKESENKINLSNTILFENECSVPEESEYRLKQ